MIDLAPGEWGPFDDRAALREFLGLEAAHVSQTLSPRTRSLIHCTQTTTATYRTVFAMAIGTTQYYFEKRSDCYHWLGGVRLVSGILRLHEDVLCSGPSCNARRMRTVQGTC